MGQNRELFIEKGKGMSFQIRKLLKLTEGREKG